MESTELTKEEKQDLKQIYESLNPAQLKRDINKKLMRLYKLNRQKRANLNQVDFSSQQRLLKPTSPSVVKM